MAEINGTRRNDGFGVERWDARSAAEPQTPLKRADAPWNVDYDKIPAGISHYDRSVLAAPGLVVPWPATHAKRADDAPSSASAKAGPDVVRTSTTSNRTASRADAAWNMAAKAPMPTIRATPSATCTPLVATPDNAWMFADRGVPLSMALKDGAFGSTADLERFIDEYIAYSARHPEMKQLHGEALRTGPEILARRLDADDAEAARRVEEQRMHDRIGSMQVRPPLPIQQRAAVGEVAIPIARATVAVGKLIPVAGELIILAEVATGRDIAGLGEKLEPAERAIEAALVVAPFAMKALGAGARGAAELIRLARSTGHTVDETRAACRIAVEVSRNRAVLREGIAAAKAGRALSAEQRAAMEAVGDTGRDGAVVDGLRRRTYKPTVTSDPTLPAGVGATDKYGNVTFSPHGSAKDVALAQAHEAVHSFLSPKAINGLRELRADLGMTAYQKSALCQFLEEALAESYAQVKVNGITALPHGLRFPIREGYVTLGRVGGEAAIGTIVYGGILYGVYMAVNRK